jgi:choline dehydrogenase-like flavoprotein
LFNPAGSEASFHILPVLLNGKSRGEITLRSANPADPPVTDPKFLTHPFDQRVAIETSRKCMEIAALQPFAKDILDVVAGPKSSSDEDLLV